MNARTRTARCILFPLLLALACQRQIDIAGGVERAAGINPEREATLTVDVLLDTTDGSPGTNEAVIAEQLNDVLPAVARRDGVLRVWVIADEVENTHPIITEQFAPSTSTNLNVQERERKTKIEEARRDTFSAVHRALQSHPRQSLLFESLTKIALANTTGERIVILASDLREESSFIRAECAPLPDKEPLAARLDAARVLTPGSLRGVTVACAYFNVDPVAGGRCRNSIAKHLALQSLWQFVLTRAGARVIFTTGPYTFGG